MPIFDYIVNLSRGKRLVCHSYFDPFELNSLFRAQFASNIEFAWTRFCPSIGAHQIVLFPGAPDRLRGIATQFLLHLYSNFSCLDYYEHAKRISSDPQTVNYCIQFVHTNNPHIETF